MSLEQKINYQLNKSPRLKKTVKSAYQHAMYAISPKIKSEGNIIRISPNDPFHEYFFGYYDKSPWDSTDRYMLCMRANDTWSDVSPKEKADILVIDTSLSETDENRVSKIAETSAWNVQQSCMLQWLGPDFSSRILFNDYRNGRYVAVIKEIDSGAERVIDAPVYTVSTDGKTALTLDFSRLYNLRPGYGYYNVSEKTKGIALPDSTAVWKIDLQSGDVTPLLSYKDFASFQPRSEMKEEGAVHKVNHLMICPNGNRFMVLYRWFVGERKFTRLVTCNIDGTGMYVLSDDDMVSHCFWKDDEYILAFENKREGGTGYYLMKDKTQEYRHCWPELTGDGHPSYSYDRSHIVTDSYPDRARIQYLRVMKDEGSKPEIVAKVFSPFKYDNDTRCDLHPRWNHAGDRICFDSVFEGHRGLYVINYKGFRVPEKVSVVMCTYNGEKYLKQQIDSILNQTVVPDEIIITDDCSKDSTMNILMDYYANDPGRFIISQNEINKGFIGNFMSGIIKAKGDIIILSDQDDIWYKHKVEKYLLAFKEHKDALAINAAYDQIDENNKIIINRLSVKQNYTGELKKIAWRDFIISPRYPGMSLTIRRETLSYLLPLKDDDIPAHDWYLNEAAAYNNGLYYLAESLTGYRQHSNNTVGTVSGNDADRLIKARLHTLGFFAKTHKAIKMMHHEPDIQSFANELIRLDEQRMINFEKRSTVGCVITYLKYRKVMSRRCFMGDTYSTLKLKRKVEE